MTSSWEMERLCATFTLHSRHAQTTRIDRLIPVILRHLQIRNFRNVERAGVTAAERTTLIVGPNGHGKTNSIEAIFVLATLRPLRAARFAELVRWGSETAEVEAEIEVRGVGRTVAVKIEDGARRALIDGKPTRSLEEYFGGISVVAFTPDDLVAVKGSPEARRRLIDRATFNRFPAYLKESREYQRALKSRNKLLRSGANPAELDAFAEPLARSGARLITRRRSLVVELAPRIAEAYQSIAHEETQVGVSYEPAHLPAEAQSEEAVVSALREEIARRTARDVERGFTSVGPHTDDLTLTLKEHSARAFGSQGQQRALVIAMKIAEIENLRSTQNMAPLLLLDDVSSELDPERNRQLMNYLATTQMQVFLTTTDARAVAAAVGPGARYYAVNSGALTETSREAL
jgi:DNA replication and repair protein RecF